MRTSFVVITGTLRGRGEWGFLFTTETPSLKLYPLNAGKERRNRFLGDETPDPADPKPAFARTLNPIRTCHCLAESKRPLSSHSSVELDLRSLGLQNARSFEHSVHGTPSVGEFGNFVNRNRIECPAKSCVGEQCSLLIRQSPPISVPATNCGTGFPSTTLRAGGMTTPG